MLVAHFIAAAVAPLLVRRWGRNAFLALAVVPGLSTVWAFFQLPTVLDGGELTSSYAWAPEFSFRLGTHMDTLGLLMTLIAAGVGTLVLIYCARYFSDSEPGLGRFAGVFVAFAGAMLGLVLADDLIQLFIYWELTTVFSYLLVGHNTELQESRRAAMTALTVTTLGGLAMLVGMIMLGETAGTYVIAEIVAAPPTGAIVQAALVLIMIGAMSKSALFPFGLWLPAAMRAPTPVSAYLHAAAMVKAGVYLVARLTPAFEGVAVWQAMAVFFGVLTMVLAGWKALRQTDLKLVLASGTISQLGFLIALLGTGNQYAALAGISMLLAHTLFKAPLFLVVGIIDHSTGTRDIRRLSGLRSSMPGTFWVSVVAAASMAGLPPTLGFAAKELAFGAYVGGGFLDTVVLAGLVVGSTFTVAYSLRFLWGAFSAKENVPETHVHAPGPLFLAPAVVLAALSLAGGPLSAWLDRFFAVYADTVEPLGPGGYEAHLALWHGWELPLLLSAVCVVGGALLFRFRDGVERVNRAMAVVDADRIYRRMLAGLDNLALQATGATQRGSLPVYLGTILVVLVVGAVWPIITGRIWELPTPELRLWDTPVQVIPAAIMVVTTLAAVFVRRRLYSVILVGISGYGCAALFYLQAAPDIALTQFLVETVSLVVFVLVLRRLPTNFSAPALRGRRVWNLTIGAATGLLAAFMTYYSLAGRQEESVAIGYPDAARESGGENLISVLLVDVRAWDTMGEISVLAAAAAGVASLMFLRRRPKSRKVPGGVMALSVTAPPEQPNGGSADLGALSFAPASMHVKPQWNRTWLPGADTLPTERRSIIFEVVSRFLFPVIMVISMYLLLTGHTAIGGGFAGGIVAGLAFIVRYLAGGRHELYSTAWVQPGALIGAGLAVATGTGIAGAFFGGDILAGAHGYVDFWILGEAHLTVSLFFDIGVYLLVIGLILDILRSLGARIDEQIERDAAETDEPSRAEAAKRAEEVTS
ncbi:Na+/H+ antiporter subunit A [Nocardiopsis salina]|uniref:Na+/H+ antiporter subunit A n=1 Tax=Nocardiopsis salina TaxID=245836 RepID=UPI0003461E71|nr:Na+/H+ antiporter subunit A [Nocardiopsis salina]